MAAAALPASAGVLHVPADAPTIQQAIFAATSGDTILVAPGTYVEQIKYFGKTLDIRSEGGSAVTTIDAAGAGTVVTLMNHEENGTRLTGFTITGGLLAFGGGAGVLVIEDAHLELRDCVVTGNTLTEPTALGAGLRVVYPGVVTAIDCTFSGNTAAGDGSAIGTAPFTGARIDLEHCTFTGNVSGPNGAAISVQSGKPFRAFDCLIADNIGIGLHLPGNGEVERCTFSGNTGEGLIFGGGVSSPPVTDCRFLGNGAGSQVVGIGFDDEGFAAVLGCTFVHDHLYIHGGLFGTTSITNCTFDGSTINPTGQELTMRNSIVRGVPSPFLGPEAVTISYSNIQNGWPGVGNIDAHPKWIDGPAGDYGLAPSSPCINTGDPAGPIDADGSPADMGAVPYDPWTELGVGIAGVAGLPGLNGRGPLLAGSEVLLTLSGTATAQLATLVVGTSALHAPFKGGTLWPAANLVIPGLLTGDAGGFTLSAQWPAGVPGATSVWMQFWIQDGAAVQGFAASNGLRATTP